MYGDGIIIYPKPYSIYLRGTIRVQGFGSKVSDYKVAGFGFGFRGLRFKAWRLALHPGPTTLA